MVHPVVVVVRVVSARPVEVRVRERVPAVQLALEDASAAAAGQSGHVEPAEGARQADILVLAKRR